MAIIKVTTQVVSRLDRYLKRLYPELTQGVVEQLLRKGKITVNDKKIPAGYRIKDGDIITVTEQLILPTGNDRQQQIFSKPIISLAGKILSEYLIYEDEQLIAINKPAGLATQGGSKINLSIDDALKFLNNQAAEGLNYKLVHRLDKETSGVLLIAKNYPASVKLTAAFKDKIIIKKYLAVTIGSPLLTAGEITSCLSKNRNGAFEKMEEDNAVGKLAITDYKVLKKANGLALIEFLPRTGRTHQLRVHAQKLGCPIVGDRKYSNRIAGAGAESDHMLLHAKNINLPKELFGKQIVIEASLPSYFSKFIVSTHASPLRPF